MLKITDLQSLKIYLCVRNTIQHTITVPSVLGLGAMYRSFNDSPLHTAVDVNWTTAFTFILPQNSTPSLRRSVTFPLAVLQIRHISGCSTTLYGFDGSVWLTGTVCCFNDDTPKKRLCQIMFLFNRKLVHVTTVSVKGEGKIYPRNDLEDPEGIIDIALQTLRPLYSRYQMYSKLGSFRCRSERVREIGVRSRNVQLEASSYNICAREYS